MNEPLPRLPLRQGTPTLARPTPVEIPRVEIRVRPNGSIWAPRWASVMGNGRRYGPPPNAPVGCTPPPSHARCRCPFASLLVSLPPSGPPPSAPVGSHIPCQRRADVGLLRVVLSRPRVEGSRPADRPAASSFCRLLCIHWPRPVVVGQPGMPAPHMHGTIPARFLSCSPRARAVLLTTLLPQRPCTSGRRHRGCASADVFDHLDELVDGVSLPASELD
jgi:hypothetical protein